MALGVMQDEANFRSYSLLILPAEICTFFNEKHAWRIRYSFLGIDPTGQYCAIATPILPDIWIVEIENGRLMKHFMDKPPYYRDPMPATDYNDAEIWFAKWTATNIPSWIDDSTFMVNRGYGNDTMFIDVFNVNKGILYCMKTTKPLIYSDPRTNSFYVVAEIKDNLIVIERRRLK